MARQAAIVGWTGKGSPDDLESSICALALLKKRRVKRVGRSILVGGVDAVAASRALSNMPGVSWMAVGYEFSDGMDECLRLVAVLARRYMRGRPSFRVCAETDGASGHTAGDFVLAADSAVLDAVRGARVDEGGGRGRPPTRFRIVADGGAGACGVEIRAGVGGVPTSKGRPAYCLVSGGRHSSAMAWMAALSGFSLRLVHVKTSEESLRGVSKLYSELSNRMDPTHLDLEVIESPASPGKALGEWMRKEASEAPVFSGLHPECSGGYLPGPPEAIPRRALLPLVLVQEEEVLRVMGHLGLRDSGRAEDAGVGLPTLEAPPEGYRSRHFGGVRADNNAVMDEILG